MSSMLSIRSINTSGADRTPPYLDNTLTTAPNKTGDEQKAAPTNVDQLKKAELNGQRVSVSEQQLIKAIDRAIKAIQGPTTSLEFTIHKETKQIIVKVLNSETGALIREVPSEKTLDFVAKLMQQVGLIIDKRQ